VTCPLRLRPYRDGSEPDVDFSDYVGTTLSALVLPAVCIALGFWVAAVRIGDRSAWLFLVLLLSLPAWSGGGTVLGLFGRTSFSRSW
jgi:hypothetical protein